MVDTSKMIFVFGSNEGGIHGAGAARFAYENRGAVAGLGVGIMGQSYAIPTKTVIRHRVGPTLTLQVIKAYVDEFIQYAMHRHDLDFQVTAIGCGLAGLRDCDIAPMFYGAPDNCLFDTKWRHYFNDSNRQFWGTI